MDAEDLILISGFSKLAICKSRLNAVNVVGGKKLIKMHHNPLPADWGKGRTGPFAASACAG